MYRPQHPPSKFSESQTRPNVSRNLPMHVAGNRDRQQQLSDNKVISTGN